MKRIRIEHEGNEKYRASFYSDDIVVRVDDEMVYPRTDGWIKLSERRPIEADADENGFVLARFSDSKEPSFRTWFALKHWQKAVAFMPIPKFTEEKDADEEAFEKWVTPLDIEMNSRDDPFYKRCAKRGWDAALEYAKSNE